MKKVISIVAVLAITTLSASAQKESSSSEGFKIGAGATIGLPIGDVKNFSSLVFGADLQGEYAAAETVGATLSAGYWNFSGKDGFGSFSAIPVLVGGKFYFAEKAFFNAQLGVAFLSDGGGTGFAYAPGVGYKVADNVDLTVKYNAISKNGTTSFIGLRVGFTF